MGEDEVIERAQLYARDIEDDYNCDDFYEAMLQAGLWPEMRFADPTGRNPWHLQIRDESRGIIFNFWPHRLKGHRQHSSGPSVEGAQACVDLVLNTRKADSLENYSLLEDDDVVA